MSVRGIRSITPSQPAIEGAGVRLRRGFGFGKTEDFDPFLLFDDFRGEQPGDYRAGFPWHPHRGIETITYVLTEDLATDIVTRARPAENRHLILFDRGDEIRVTAGDRGLRFVLASGRPLGEPVAWHGPIVMNTQAEIRTAFRQLQDGTFLG